MSWSPEDIVHDLHDRIAVRDLIGCRVYIVEADS